MNSRCSDGCSSCGASVLLITCPAELINSAIRYAVLAVWCHTARPAGGRTGVVHVAAAASASLSRRQSKVHCYRRPTTMPATPRALLAAEDKNMRLTKPMPVVPPGMKVEAYQSSAATWAHTATTISR